MEETREGKKGRGEYARPWAGGVARETGNKGGERRKKGTEEGINDNVDAAARVHASRGETDKINRKEQIRVDTAAPER